MYAVYVVWEVCRHSVCTVYVLYTLWQCGECVQLCWMCRVYLVIEFGAVWVGCTLCVLSTWMCNVLKFEWVFIVYAIHSLHIHVLITHKVHPTHTAPNSITRYTLHIQHNCTYSPHCHIYHTLLKLKPSLSLNIPHLPIPQRLVTPHLSPSPGPWPPPSPQYTAGTRHEDLPWHPPTLHLSKDVQIIVLSMYWVLLICIGSY